MDGKPGSATSSIRFEELLDMSDQRQEPISKALATPKPMRGSSAHLKTAKEAVAQLQVGTSLLKM